jgi:hypothetical protein
MPTTTIPDLGRGRDLRISGSGEQQNDGDDGKASDGGA